MSQENVYLVRSLQDDWNRGDTSVIADKFHPDVVFEPLVAEIEGAYVGHDGIRALMANIGHLYEVFQVHLPDIRDLGERVLALGTARTIGKNSGIEQEGPVAIVASFRDGRITHCKDYGDKDRALEAVGLRE